MKFSTLVFGFGLLATSVFGFAIPTFEDAEAELARRQATNFAITGVPGATQPRLEIRQMRTQQPNQYTLLVLAMDQFQKQAQTLKTSYYQIAGIHGVPRVNWDNVGQCASCTTADGYCTHDSILFLGWHRVYLALFEQRLVAVAKQIAATYPTSTRATMQAAAAKLRLPYWDWAARPASGSNLPTAITQAQVTVNGPAGSKTLANPLFSYKFASTSALRYSPFVTWPVRSRSLNTLSGVANYLIFRQLFATQPRTPRLPPATSKKLSAPLITFVAVCRIKYTRFSRLAMSLSK